MLALLVEKGERMITEKSIGGMSIVISNIILIIIHIITITVMVTLLII